MLRSILFVGVVLASQPAFAHAFLTHATPPAGGTVKSSPGALDLFFTEAVVPHFSSVEVRNSTGQVVKTGALRTGQGGKEMIVPVPQLPAGKYTVAWHATAEDTHKTEGTYSFTVTP